MNICINYELQLAFIDSRISNVEHLDNIDVY